MARLSAWIALIFFVISFYLAIRVPVLNRIFDGLKPQLRWHHWVALLSVIAILCHLGQLLWNFTGRFQLLFDWKDVALLSGWITFVGVVLLSTPLAFFRVQIPYRRWRVIHLMTSLCLLTALLHTLLILEPKYYGEWTIFILVTVLAMISLLLAVILPAFPFWGRKYLITKFSEIRPNLFLVQLQRNEYEVSQDFHYDPGQFIYLKFITRGFSQIWHPFTIISRPSESYIELFIKARGRDTNHLRTISVPAPIRVLAPFGTSFWKLDQAQLWIAYGVGAAIFLAAVRSFPPSFRKNIHFICCDSSETNVFFSEELNRLMQTSPQFTWELYIGSGQQFIAEFKHKPFSNRSFEHVRICGHPGFQKSLKMMLIYRGIQRRNIQLEGLL